MNRRRFLEILGLSVAVTAVDPERLVWVPDRKKIFIPSVFIPSAADKDEETGDGGFVTSKGFVDGPAYIYRLDISSERYHEPRKIKLIRNGSGTAFLTVWKDPHAYYSWWGPSSGEMYIPAGGRASLLGVGDVRHYIGYRKIKT